MSLLDCKVRGFAVTIERVSEVKAHPGADRLELAYLDGMEWQFVVPKDKFKGAELLFLALFSRLLTSSLPSPQPASTWYTFRWTLSSRSL